MPTTFTWQIKDKDDNNVTTLTCSRADFNWSGNIKTWSVTSTPGGATRGTPRFFDFGRKTEGFVLYGIMQSWTEVMALRTLLNGKYWEKRPPKLYISSGDSHSGQVADFKAYMDRTQGGEALIKFTLTFVIASKFSDALP